MRSTPSIKAAHAIIHRSVPSPTSVLQFTDELPDEEELEYDIEAGIQTPEFESMKLGGVVELGHLSAPIQFTILALGMFVLYITHAYYQEKIFTVPGFRYGFFVSFCDFTIFCALACVQLLVLEGHIPRNAPLKNFMGISGCLAVSIGCGFASLSYLNYPTKVLFKSGKIIPTMLLGRVFGRHYSLFEYFAALLLCGGLAAFTLGQASVSPAFHIVGVALISAAAFSEAGVGNFQENVLKHYKCKLLEIVFWSNLFSGMVVLVFLLATGSFMEGVAFLYTPGVLRNILAEATVGYLGVFFYLGVVQRFGVAVCIGVSALRKVATILLSFIAFPKPFTMMYVYGATMVLVSILMTAWAKNQRKRDHKRAKTHAI